MHSNRLLDEAIELAGQLGYVIRLDHLNGEGTGHCRVGDQRLLLIDVAQPVDEQLERTVEAVSLLAVDDNQLECSEELRDLIAIARKAAELE